MHIHYADAIPATLSAWDAIPSSTLSRAARDAEQQAADRSVRCEMLEHDLHRFIACGGDVSAPLVFFAKRATTGKHPTLENVVLEGLDYDDLRPKLAKLLMDAAAGYPVSETARDLLGTAVALFVDGEV